MLFEHVVNIVVNDPTVYFLLVGLVFCIIAFAGSRILANDDNRTNDRYLPTRSINSIKERHNKYDWK